MQKKQPGLQLKKSMNNVEALNALGESGVSSAAGLLQLKKRITEAFKTKMYLADIDGNKIYGFNSQRWLLK